MQRNRLYTQHKRLFIHLNKPSAPRMNQDEETSWITSNKTQSLPYMSLSNHLSWSPCPVLFTAVQVM